MIGLDANVLVRLLTADEPIQLKAATQLLASFDGQANSFYINDMVLVELVWVLRRLYGFERKDTLPAVQSLLSSDAFVFEDRARLSQVIRLCSEQALDFADTMIALINIDAPCEYTATFDEAMVSLPKVKLLCPDLAEASDVKN
jgi:predicted nucleic-acid-binding protein